MDGEGCGQMGVGILETFVWVWYLYALTSRLPKECGRMWHLALLNQLLCDLHRNG